MYFITLPFLVRKIFTCYINDVPPFKCPFPGPKGKRGLNKDLEDNIKVHLERHAVSVWDDSCGSEYGAMNSFCGHVLYVLVSRITCTAA